MAPDTDEQRVVAFNDALNEAMREEMAANDRMIVIGEDIAASNGLFGVTDGLLEQYGRARVIDSPIAESGITGFGIGAGLVGAPTVVELQIFDFVTVAMDQLVNHAAKWRYMSGGHVSVPLVVRGPTFTGFGMAAQHSQSLEAWFVNTPGVVVMMPSTPYDAKGLLKAAIRDPNPVVFIEKRGLYQRKGHVPAEDYVLPIGKGDIKRDGTDITIVATGQMVAPSLQVARKLESDRGISAEVIDPRTLKPLDTDLILDSVHRTGALVVVNEGPPSCGFAEHVVALAAEQAFGALRVAPVAVTAEDTPIPYAASLERRVLPNRGRIEEAVLKAAGA